MGADEPKDRGAVLVELVLVLPLILALFFGIVEFGWAFSQRLDVQHGTREGLRLAQVNYNPFNDTGMDQTLALGAESCDRMSRAEGREVEFSFTTGTGVGDLVTVTVTSDLEQLSGFFGPLLDGAKISNQLTGRLEVPATYDPNPGVYRVVCP